jgi:hypothetical protein
MSISRIPSKNVKCPTCSQTPNCKKIQNILSDVMAYRDNRPFNPEDPIIVSETEIYCSGTCYVLAVIKEEEDNDKEQQSL